MASMATLHKQHLTGLACRDYMQAHAAEVAAQVSLDREKEMPENKNDFRKALAGVIDARGREATRSVARAREHLLLGALTKRPN